MSYPNLESLMNAIESFVISIGVIIGGIWALYTFKKLRQSDKAKADLEDKKLEQLKKEAELKVIEHREGVGSVVEINIISEQKSFPNDSFFYISATVEIMNKGKYNTRLRYGETRRPFSVYSVKITNDGSSEFVKIKSYGVPLARNPKIISPSVIVRAGGSEKLPFFFKLKDPGLYLLVFRAIPSNKDREIASKLGANFSTSWVGKKYIMVKEGL